jgi:hypothetical protein
MEFNSSSVWYKTEKCVVKNLHLKPYSLKKIILWLRKMTGTCIRPLGFEQFMLHYTKLKKIATLLAPVNLF